jgi:hypothetical protein
MLRRERNLQRWAATANQEMLAAAAREFLEASAELGQMEVRKMARGLSKRQAVEILIAPVRKRYM